MKLFLVLATQKSLPGSPHLLFLEMPDEAAEDDVGVFVLQKYWQGVRSIVVHEVSGDATSFRRDGIEALEDRGLLPTVIGSFVG